MAFMRRKSGVYHDDVYQEDSEYQRRRRLSKPLTNTSCTSLPSLSVQQLTRRKSLGKTVEGSATPPSNVPSSNASREALRSHLFMSPSELDQDTPRPKRSAVAMIAMKFERHAQASVSQLSLPSPTLPQRSMLNIPSPDQIEDHNRSSVNSLGTNSSASSADQLANDPAPPARRTASFTPGTATRIENMPQEAIDEETEPAMSLAEAVALQNFVRNTLLLGSQPAQATSPQEDRCVTPSDLEYPNIGRLGPGSLRIVNGAPSPAPTMLSRNGKHLLLSLERRDTSSIYPESEIGTVKSRRSVKSQWEDEEHTIILSHEDAMSMPDVRRAFSFKPGTEGRFNFPDQQPSTNQLESVQQSSNDVTRNLADEYIAGLPLGPFDEQSSPEGAISPSSDITAEKPMAESSLTEDQELAAHFTEPQSCKLASSPMSAGTVRRYKDKAHGKRSFIDNTVEPLPVQESSSPATSFQERPRSESPASFFSVPETDNGLEDHFKSAVELQPVGSRSRERSPQKSIPRSPLKQSLLAQDVQFAENKVKPDSGYGSNASLVTILPSVDLELTSYRDPETPMSQVHRRGLKLPFRKAANKTGRGVLVMPSPSTKVPSPKSVKIESASAMTSSASLHYSTEAIIQRPSLDLQASAKGEKDKQKKKLQKVRRKSTADTAGQLVIQRLASVESFNVPVVTPTARVNLAQRSKVVPELDRTYKTQHHTAKNSEGSIVSLAPPPPQDLRFPSPVPEEMDRQGRSRSRTRTRKRSLSRPKSWFGWGKDSRDEKKSTYHETPELDLNDMGSVVDLLGDNGYDLASNNPYGVVPAPARKPRPDLNRGRTSPANVPIVKPQPKQSMDDYEAAMLSKKRRSASMDRETCMSRTSFDDRGGVPGRLPHARVILDAPPMPAMPTQEEIDRRFSYRHGYATHPRPLSYEAPKKSKSVPVEVDHETPPPLPPLHSPRPSYIDDGDLSEQANPFEEAPLPPRHSPAPSFIEDYPAFNDTPYHEDPSTDLCHSPRKMDRSHHEEEKSRDVSWGLQANAWRDRRQSASAALNRSWNQAQQSYYPTQQGSRPSSAHDQPFYASQNGGYADQSLPQQDAYLMWQDGSDQEQDFLSHTWYQDEPEYAQDNMHPREYQDYYQHAHGEFSRPRLDEYPLYATYSQQSVAYDDCYYQAEPQAYDNYQHCPILSTSHGSHSSQRFYAEYNSRKEPRPQLQARAKTFDAPYRPPPEKSHDSRPASRHSNVSHHSRKSLAEELHPELRDVSPPRSALSRTHSPHIGRYSGGLEYNYDQQARGFDGSAGTRSGSTNMGANGKRDGRKRNSWLDMEAYGIDLGDVPTIAVPVRKTGPRMIYH